MWVLLYQCKILSMSTAMWSDTSYQQNVFSKITKIDKSVFHNLSNDSNDLDFFHDLLHFPCFPAFVTLDKSRFTVPPIMDYIHYLTLFKQNSKIKSEQSK